MKRNNISNISKSRETKRPFVSVVIPVFNGAQYLIEAVESIQKNTYDNFEIILVNDGSTDISKILCKRLEGKYKNVRFFDFTKNRGLGRVLNFALDKARGKYICRLNQDDRMLPIRITTQVKYLENHPEVTAVGSSIKLFENNGKTQILHFIKDDSEIKKLWYFVSPFSDPSVMYRKEVALKVGGYDQYFWPADDTHLWYRMGLAGKLSNIQKPLVEVRWHNNAASVKFFRRLAIKTYQMHRWTHEIISPAPWFIQVYWVLQLMAGFIFSPQFNWNVYRSIKKLIDRYENNRDRLTAYIAPNKVISVSPHPKKLSLSGI
jgi:glycosyltransferase involved in cell wall biosynthesis